MTPKKSIIKILLSLIISIIGEGVAYAFPASFYSSSSRLSEGKWAKIEVSATGLQFLSDEDIKALGFDNPESVNIFGYGGEVIPENLDSPDDLPLLPSYRVDKGIVFFGKNSIGWKSNPNGKSAYTHISHPYSDNSYYFISDCLEYRESPAHGEEIFSSGEQITAFTERIHYEKDEWMPMNTGRLMLGEDFRTVSERHFNLSLPGITGNALMTASFGCKTSSGISTLVFSANGKQLGATTSDRMAASDSRLIVTTTTVKEIENPGENLELGIKFNGSGNVSAAGLDYIEIEYNRDLKLNSGYLYFYISPKSNSRVVIEGGDESTIVWDVSVPHAPEVVTTEYKDGKISFHSSSGYHEYVAFTLSGKFNKAVPAGRVGNQNIHGMESPDMLVISPAQYLYAAGRLASLHKDTDGLNVAVITPEDIYNEFSSGKPDVSAFRKLLKMWYDRAEGRIGEYPLYCLIMSRPTYDNKMVTTRVRQAGYPRVLIWQSETGDSESTSYSTDDYIGMLKDIDGQFSIGSAEIQVAVARMPVKSLSEANSAIDKLEKYLLRQDLGNWRNNVMVIADDQDKGVHLEQAEEVVASMRATGRGNDFLYEKIYLDAYRPEYGATGMTYPQAHNKMLQKWNEGVSLINYIGHANSKSWGHEGLLTWKDINGMNNSILPFIYASTCDFMRWDDDEISGAEVLWSTPDAGVIGMICPSREVLIAANGTLNKATSQFFMHRDAEGRALSVGEIMVKGKNLSNTGNNKLRYGLIGDPSLRLPIPLNRVVADEINGIRLEGNDEYPVLKAKSEVKVSGHIDDFQGNPISDFNGLAEIVMYDAEKAITTYGNGDDGVESVYNDRKTRLFTGRTKVENGKWAINFTMPSEIENNYSPALLSFYAFEPDRRDAGGSTTQFYVYGYNDDSQEDIEGPKIIEFYLDNPSFVSGNEVSPNPVLNAIFYDESGINLSEAGIGHNITLRLDGERWFDDVAMYYVSDENDSRRGSLVYPLEGLEPGDHTLTFTVWDNANNSTSATLDFRISPLWKPSIETLVTDVNPATSSVNFIVATDGISSSMECTIEVYDLTGRRVWREKTPAFGGISSRTTLEWDLCDNGGARIPGGLYIYRASVKTDSGATVTKSNKLIVTGK